MTALNFEELSEEKKILEEQENEEIARELFKGEESSWREENRKKGRRLEDITERALERMKKVGIFKGSIEHFPDKKKPDVVVKKDIGFECKNRDLQKKNVFTKNNVETQITNKFEGKWRKKILITTKLKIYPRDEEECRKLLEDYIIIELGDFVTEENKDDMEEKLFNELIRRKSEIFG